MPQPVLLAVAAEAATRNFLQEQLQTEGEEVYQFAAFEAAPAALDYVAKLDLAQQLPAIALIERHHHALPPYEFIRQLRSLNPDLQFIVLDGRSDEPPPPEQDELAALGAYHQVAKPVQPPQLHHAVEKSFATYLEREAEATTAEPLQRLNHDLHSLNTLVELNSFHNAFLQAALRHTNALRGYIFIRGGEMIRIAHLLAAEMEENMALQRDFQSDPESLAQSVKGVLQGPKAQHPARLVLPVSILGEETGTLLLEKEEQSAGFGPLERNMARTLAHYYSQTETVRLLRSRIDSDKRSSENIRREYEELKQIAKIQHQSIDQSLKYARLANRMIMPQTQEVQRYHPNSFIYYRTRDLVSGQFFWYTEHYFKFMLAVADTRVPGIAGGFLSLMNHRFIEEVVETMAMPKPKGILANLHEKLLMASGKMEDGSQVHGLRIGMVSVDESVDVVRYAGADLPLWLLREGTLKRLDSAGHPLGIEPFPGYQLKLDQHTLQLNGGDRIYFTTTGLLELRGGETLNPLGVEQFEKMLRETAHLSIPDQKAAIGERIDQWLGGKPPSHDLLLSGIEIIEKPQEDDED